MDRLIKASATCFVAIQAQNLLPNITLPEAVVDLTTRDPALNEHMAEVANIPEEEFDLAENPLGNKVANKAI